MDRNTETSTNGETTKAKVFKKFDVKKPIYVVFYQTAAKNIFEPFEAEAEARAFAQKRAEGGNNVALFGPQSSYFMEVPKPVAEEVKLDLDDQTE